MLYDHNFKKWLKHTFMNLINYIFRWIRINKSDHIPFIFTELCYYPPLPSSVFFLVQVRLSYMVAVGWVCQASCFNNSPLCLFSFISMFFHFKLFCFMESTSLPPSPHNLWLNTNWFVKYISIADKLKPNTLVLSQNERLDCL